MAQSSYFRRELLPPARAFYQRELRKLSRADRKGWAKADCPFHKSKSHTSLSVNLDGGHFRCHGCNAKGGDVLAFFCQRYGYTFQTGAKLLGAWRENLGREERMRVDERVAKIRFEQEQAEQAKQGERNQRLRLRDEIHTTARIYSETNDRLSVLLQAGAPAENQIEPCWAVLSLGLDDLRSCEREYMEILGLEYAG
jgi:hypothetical protein